VDRETPSGSNCASGETKKVAHKAGGEFKRSLDFWKLCGLTFASVAGGPYGFEEAVGSGGPYLTIVGLLLVPFVWSVPNALMTAELACMMPENGGHILWVDRAFGPFWSFLNSYATLFSLIFEGGLYPVMFMDYVGQLMGVSYSSWLRISIGLVVVVFVTVINIRGTDLVGSASLAFTVASLGPFIIIIVLGAQYTDLVEVVQVVPHNTQWGPFITILLWSTSGFDLVGACAGEVKDPAETFPTAMSFAMCLCLVIDLASMVVGMSVVHDYDTWHDGTFMDVAFKLGGPTLTTIFTFGAAISVIGLLCTLLCSSSRIIYGMAVVGTLPKVFAKTHPVYGTPYVAIISNSIAMACVLFMPFGELAEGEMWFYCVSTILKFGALVKLRKMEPDKPRPYRIPMSDTMLNWFCFFPTLLCILVIGVAEWKTHVMGIGGVVLSCIAFRISVHLKGTDKLIAFDVLEG